MSRYSPEAWRSVAQIREYIYSNHQLRLVAVRGQSRVIFVNDTTKTVHEMQAKGTGTKVGLLDVLRRLDEGEKAEQTPESRQNRANAYALYAR